MDLASLLWEESSREENLGCKLWMESKLGFLLTPVNMVNKVNKINKVNEVSMVSLVKMINMVNVAGCSLPSSRIPTINRSEGRFNLLLYIDPSIWQNKTENRRGT